MKDEVQEEVASFCSTSRGWEDFREKEQSVPFKQASLSCDKGKAASRNLEKSVYKSESYWNWKVTEGEQEEGPVYPFRTKWAEIPDFQTFSYMQLVFRMQFSYSLCSLLIKNTVLIADDLWYLLVYSF